MKNLENKNISKVRNNKNQSIFNNSQFVLNILYAQVLSIKIIKAILVDSFLYLKETINSFI